MFTMYCFFDGIFTVIGNNTVCGKNGIVNGNWYSKLPIIVFILINSINLSQKNLGKLRF